MLCRHFASAASLSRVDTVFLPQFRIVAGPFTGRIDLAASDNSHVMHVVRVYAQFTQHL
jgi:hypothetical protein